MLDERERVLLSDALAYMRRAIQAGKLLPGRDVVTPHDLAQLDAKLKLLANVEHADVWRRTLERCITPVDKNGIPIVAFRNGPPERPLRERIRVINGMCTLALKGVDPNGPPKE